MSPLKHHRKEKKHLGVKPCAAYLGERLKDASIEKIRPGLLTLELRQEQEPPSVTLEDNLVIFNKPITGASYERHGGGRQLVRCLFAFGREISEDARGKTMPIPTPGDVLNDGPNLILQY